MLVKKMAMISKYMWREGSAVLFVSAVFLHRRCHVFSGEVISKREFEEGHEHVEDTYTLPDIDCLQERHDMSL